MTRAERLFESFYVVETRFVPSLGGTHDLSFTHVKTYAHRLCPEERSSASPYHGGLGESETGEWLVRSSRERKSS